MSRRESAVMNSEVGGSAAPTRPRKTDKTKERMATLREQIKEAKQIEREQRGELREATRAAKTAVKVEERASKAHQKAANKVGMLQEKLEALRAS